MEVEAGSTNIETNHMFLLSLPHLTYAFWSTLHELSSIIPLNEWSYPDYHFHQTLRYEDLTLSRSRKGAREFKTLGLLRSFS